MSGISTSSGSRCGGDVRRVAESRLAQPWLEGTHFLGAVVLQAMENPINQLGARAIIDGQQRLTTLQLFVDAVSAVFEDLGLEDLAAQLAALAHNPDAFVTDGDTLKLRHGNRDAAPFREVMLADPPVDHGSLKHRETRLSRAHQYFTQASRQWLAEDEPALRTRGAALTSVLTNGLQLVVIDLSKGENSQEIFETLNARGTPLTAADLIKNFVFQRLAAESVDPQHAYQNLWPFDTTFWEKEVSVGRYLISRSSLFFNQWLGSRVGEEIGPTSTFSRFKSFVEPKTGSNHGRAASHDPPTGQDLSGLDGAGRRPARRPFPGRDVRLPDPGHPERVAETAADLVAQTWS